MTSYTFTLVSDLHGWKPALPGGDVLIIAGDLVAHSTEEDYANFRDWVAMQPYKKIIITPGNHDTLIQDDRHWWMFDNKDVDLLIDEGVTWKGIKFYATPWILLCEGMGREVRAFSCDNEADAQQHFDKIPQDTNVLITHSPPFGILDTAYEERCGSLMLLNKVAKLPHLKLHVFGHIHEASGTHEANNVTYINASSVDARYKPRNPPYLQHVYNTEEE